MGHLARECKWRTRRVEQELRPKPVNHNPRLSTITAKPQNPTSEKEQNVGKGSLEGRVAKLRQQLQEAEVEETLERAKGTMHGISSPDAKDNPHLGPIIYSEVQLEGIPVQALLDTGSPATIVSLEFLIEARWKTKPPHLTRKKWEEDFKKKLKSPEITLQNYGGDRLNIVGQTVQAKIEDNKSTRQVYFEAAQNELAKRGLIVEDGMVEPNPNGNIALAIQNHSLSPVHLEENQQLGRIEDAVILSIKGEANEEGSASVATQVKAISQNGGRQIEKIKEALRINSLQLAQEDKDQLLELVDDYSDIFALDQSELGHTDIVTHTIDTGDHPPLHQPARRIPFALRAKVEEMVEDMMDQGVVQPSTSPWASPIVLVAKKDGSTRFCVDYRHLNSITKKDVYPLPRIDDTLDALARRQYFTTLDLASGYWQVGMDGQS